MKKLLAPFLFLLLFSCCVQRDTIQLTTTASGLFTTPAIVNGVASVPFIIDTGASSTMMPLSLFHYLVDMGTVSISDKLSPINSVLADGSVVRCGRFNLKSLTIGNKTVKNVEVNVMDGGVLLIGASTLKKFNIVTFNYNNNTMTINDTIEKE